MTFTQWWKKRDYRFTYWYHGETRRDHQKEKETKAIALVVWKAARRELKKEMR